MTERDILDPRTWTTQETNTPKMKTPSGETVEYKGGSLIINDVPTVVSKDDILEIKIINEDEILFRTLNEFGLFNYKTLVVIKKLVGYRFQVDFLSDTNILFRKHNLIEEYDSHLNLLKEASRNFDRNPFYKLPNDQLVTVDRNTLIVWNWDKGVIFEKKGVEDEFIVLPDGRIVVSIRRKGLEVYK